jgi:gamma-glutamyltranspeptidase/glutathione hydrolase
MWELEDGYEGVFGWRRVKDNAHEVGYLATALPGTVAGLCRIHALFGKRPLAQVVEPAIALAEDGIPVDWRLTLNVAGAAESLARFPASAQIFLRNGLPPLPGSFYTRGDRLVQKDLGRMLRAIAGGGAAAFYQGEFAELAAAHMAEVGGLISAQDLRAYQPLIYADDVHTYRGVSYVSCDSPILVEALNILESFDLASLGAESADYRHLVIEALWRAFVDNLAYNGDPSFVDVPRRALVSKAYARDRVAEIDRQGASRRFEPGDPWLHEGRPRPTQPLGTIQAGALGHTS